MLKKIRVTLGSLFLIGLTLLFLDFTGTLHHYLGWMAKVQALEAVLALNVVIIIGLVVLTFVFGRIYCSVICPLGVMQDLFGWLGKKSKKNRYTFSKDLFQGSKMAALRHARHLCCRLSGRCRHHH